MWRVQAQECMEGGTVRKIILNQMRSTSNVKLYSRFQLLPPWLLQPLALAPMPEPRDAMSIAGRASLGLPGSC